MTACPQPQLVAEAQPGVVAYLVCSSQWATDGGMGRRTGLRYSDCMALLDRYLPRWQREQPGVWDALAVDDLMQDVQIIEAAMLDAWAEQAEAERNKAPLPGVVRTIGARA